MGKPQSRLQSPFRSTSTCSPLVSALQAFTNWENSHVHLHRLVEWAHQPLSRECRAAFPVVSEHTEQKWEKSQLGLVSPDAAPKKLCSCRAMQRWAEAPDPRDLVWTPSLVLGFPGGSDSKVSAWRERPGFSP